MQKVFSTVFPVPHTLQEPAHSPKKRWMLNRVLPWTLRRWITSWRPWLKQCSTGDPFCLTWIPLCPEIKKQGRRNGIWYGKLGQRPVEQQQKVSLDEVRKSCFKDADNSRKSWARRQKRLQRGRERGGPYSKEMQTGNQVRGWGRYRAHPRWTPRSGPK